MTTDLLLGTLAAVTLERSGRGELAKFVADHVFGDEHLHMLAAVMNHERNVDELRNDRATTCPSFDRLLPSTLGLLLNFEEDLRIDVRTLFAAATHVLP